MQLEVVRSLVDALRDPTNGVLAQLLALPKDAGDEVSDDVLVVDGTSDNALAKGSQIARGDAELMLMVTPDGPTVTRESPAKTEFAWGTTPVSVLAVHRGNAEPGKKVQDVEYLLRACVLTLQWYFTQRADGGVRVRNHVTLLRVMNVRYGLVTDDGLGALGAVVFTVESLDKRAQRTV